MLGISHSGITVVSSAALLQGLGWTADDIAVLGAGAAR